MRQPRALEILAFAVTVSVSGTAFAHMTGSTDHHGCHSDRRSGNYHCHRGEYKNVTFRSKSEMADYQKAGKSGAVLRREQGQDNPAPPTILGSVLGTEEETERTASNSEVIVPKGIERRLEILDDLRQQGLISDDEYQTKRSEILGDL